MAIIQIKRIQTHPYGLDGADLLEALRDGELGYVIDENKLYIGSDRGNVLINDSSGLGPLIEEIKKSGVGKIEWNPNTLQLKVYDLENSPVSSKHVTLTHTHKYAGSASAGGAANSAIKLIAADGSEVIVGSDTQPVYFSNGTPVACGNTLDVNISKNAATASHLAESRTFTINGTAADGGTSFNGSTDAALKLPKILNGFTSITANKFIGNIEGKATSADKLSTNAGTSSKPVYFANGIPVICDNELDVSIKGQAQLAAQLATGRTISINGEAGTTGTEFNGSKNIGLTIPQTLTGLTSITSSKFIGDLEGTADEAKKLTSSAGSNVKPIYFAEGVPVECSDSLDVNINKNAATADHWKNIITLTYKNDVTGSVSFDGSTSKDVTLTLKNSGVTAGTYGPAANKTLDFGEGFDVPKYTVDAKGRLTSTSTVTYTLPSIDAYVNNLKNKTIVPDEKTYTFNALSDLSFNQTDNQINVTENEYILNLEDFAFTEEVESKIEAIPKPMIFKGTVGTGGTKTTLPTADASTIGHTYRVVSSLTVDGTTSTPGDLWICAKISENPDTYKWVHVINTDETHVASAAQANKWTTARKFTISGTPSGSTASVDGSKDITLYLPKTIGKFDKVSATSFEGALSGNASSATEFSSNATIKLIGAITGEASSKKGWEIATTLASIHDTGGSGGPTTDPSGTPLAHSGTFTVPYFEYDAQGRITSVIDRTYKLPTDNSTDTKVTQAYSTADGSYPLLFTKTNGITSTSSRGATTAILNNSIYANPSAGTITATKFIGALEGNASSATALATGRKISIDGTPGTSGTTFDGSKAISLILPETIGTFKSVSATSFTGDLTGNASSADAFSSDALVKLTGDVIGEVSSTKGWTVDTTLKELHSGGNGGPAENATLAHSGTFTVPYFEYDKNGRITAVVDRTYTLPADKNTDTKVTQAAAITTKAEYPIILGYSTATTAVTNTVNKTSTLTYNPGDQVLTAPKFKGNLTGTADSAKQWSENRKFSINKIADDDGTTDKNPIKVNVNGSKDIALTVPTVMTGFESITSDKFVGQASRALKFETYTNSSKTATYGNQRQVAAYWETGSGPIRLASDQQADKYKVKVDQADLADKATIADTADKWTTARTFTFKGDVSGTLTMDGSQSLDCTLTVANDSHSHSNYLLNTLTNIELNNSDSNKLKDCGGFLDFHFINADGNPTDSAGNVVSARPDYTSRIIENGPGQLLVNGVLFKNNVVTATKFKGALEGNASTASTWADSRNFTISDYTDTNQGVNSAVNGSANVDLKMPKNVEVSTITVNKSETTGTGVKMEFDTADESLMFVFA